MGKDNFGNYAFGYSTQNSEMAEQGNDQLKKGHFANIMSDGKLRRVDYVANDQGFHILRDTADNTGRFIKREAEPSVDPDLIRTRMTAYMDSSLLRDYGEDLHGMANMMGQDMSTSTMRPRNNQNYLMRRPSGMVNHGMSSNMMGRDMSTNVMGRGRYTNVMGRDSTSSLMGHDMSTNMMGQDMATNMIGHDRASSMLDRN